MPKTDIAAGESIVCRCTRCGDERKHTIVALVDGAIAKVQCDTCQGVHKYRAPASSKTGTKKKKTTGTRKTKASKQMAEAAALLKDWEKLTTGIQNEKPVAYSMTVELAENDLVDHKVFGIGVVKKTIFPDKAEILFQQGIKILRCKTA